MVLKCNNIKANKCNIDETGSSCVLLVLHWVKHIPFGCVMRASARLFVVLPEGERRSQKNICHVLPCLIILIEATPFHNFLRYITAKFAKLRCHENFTHGTFGAPSNRCN